MVNVVPLPTVLSTLMWPPCCSIIVLQLVRPSPVPVCFVVNSGSNICGMTSLDIPGPLSRILIMIFSFTIYELIIISPELLIA